MNREEALEIIKKNVKNPNLISHMIATEAVMRGLAEKLGEDPDKWGLAGLLHDVDYDLTVNDFPKHGIVAMEILKDYNLDDDILYAIKAHPGNLPRNNLIDKALYAADPITGLIVAAALVHPTKKIENLKVKSIKKRFKDKRFAAGANRDQIKSCSELNMELDEFFEIALNSMQKVADEIGL